MSFSLRGVAWTAFAAAVVLLLGSSVLLYRATTRQRAGDALVAHTHEVQTVIEDLGSEVFEASNSRRAFVITGNETLLAGYHSAIERIPKDLAQLRRLSPDAPERQEERLWMGRREPRSTKFLRQCDSTASLARKKDEASQALAQQPQHGVRLLRNRR